ncbi:UNVERIFIED_CONTAM: hypothetical protein RMT77_008136 [Armadillidium vulgare]
MWRFLKIIFGVLIILIVISFLIYNFRFADSYVTVTLDTDEPSSLQSRLEGPLLAEDPQLVSYVYSNFLKPPSTLPYNFTTLSEYKKEKPFLRKERLHEFVYNTFKDTDYQGFFVEAGAVDGEDGSNTLWLEYVKNWTGLLIEPDETSCKALESKHRKAWSSCSCIAPQKYATKSDFEIPHTKSEKMSDFWHYRSNVRSMNSRFHTYKDHIKETATFTYSTVQCFPLITYLQALNVTVVDLLSLDTQGGEKSMLFNFPFDKVKIIYMLVEYYRRGPYPKKNDEELVSYLNSKGFDLVKKFQGTGDYIFKLRI